MAQQGGLFQDPLCKVVPGIAALLEPVWDVGRARAKHRAIAFRRVMELRQIVGGRVPDRAAIQDLPRAPEADIQIVGGRVRVLDSDAGVAQEGRGLLRHVHNADDSKSSAMVAM